MATTTRATRRTGWRTVDIVVASMLGVAFAVVFSLWNALAYPAVSSAMASVPQLQSVYGGVWLIPGVVGALVIRKPGSALYTEFVAALLSTFLPGGATWGMSVIYYGFFEGLAPELVFLARRYRSFTLPTAMLAGAAAGLALGILDLVFYWSGWSTGWQVTYVVVAVVSAAVTAGLLGWLLVRWLAGTGVLTPFASGREQRV
jgi:energy-coupling factor transport system substrate-specific component